jgi:hypothetical protein
MPFKQPNRYKCYAKLGQKWKSGQYIIPTLAFIVCGSSPCIYVYLILIFYVLRVELPLLLSK